MSSHLSNVPMRSLNNNGGPVRKKTSARSDSVDPEGPSSSQVAHTLTACTRCRSRKTRCDPGLPRCTPCERTNSVCEYFDSSRGHNVNRSYVVYLQHKVRELEEELEKVENEDAAEDPDAMMRAATVRVQEATESKYLGPSSGIAISRLVLQLAKQFTDSKSIKDVIPEHRAKFIKDLYSQEQAKPTSKIYPMTSDVAAVDLPQRGLTEMLVTLYKLKVQPMYPALHEPSLDKDIEATYALGAQATPYQQFICRMVIAISLQKMDTQYAGLADSYYLAALQYFDAVVKPMDLKTLQCFALMGEYSLLTPTRTAIFYVIGLAVRLAQALGLNEERSIARGDGNGPADALQIDMRRRLFWCVLVMDFGLSHSLGRPAMLATSRKHIDVEWFSLVDDQYIKPEGIDPAAKSTLKKWIAIHFFKMRLLQLEIRRKLYLRKRAEPKDDSDEWFIQMESKITAWMDAAPSQDEGIGLNKVWFIGRYHTMIVFMYRPSPQVPRPSVNAAQKCYDACAYNIKMHNDQINEKNVDLTWIFTQSLIMAINTMLWSLSYEEVRRKHPKEEVSNHLMEAMKAMEKASFRWPGVASAIQLYQNLITAVLHIYEKDGDVPISAATPSESAASPGGPFADAFNHRSRTASPATASSQSVATPPEQPTPYGFMPQQARRSVEMPPPVPYQNASSPSSITTPPARPTPLLQHSSTLSSNESIPTPHLMPPRPHQRRQVSFGGLEQQYDELPQFDITGPQWTTAPQGPMNYTYAPGPMSTHAYNDYTSMLDPSNPAYPFPGADGTREHEQQYMPQYWEMDTTGFDGNGLTQGQQEELMQTLETSGMEDIQMMIAGLGGSVPTPKQPHEVNG